MGQQPDARHQTMTDQQRTRIRNRSGELRWGDRVTLADLLGDDWNTVGNDTAKRQLGKQFFGEVRDGLFPNLRFVRRNSANHAVYERI